jgi:beta-N-acetylhexosaminidase
MRRMITIPLMLLVMLTFQPLMPGNATESPLEDSATQLLEVMTPEERIGQLFIVTFRGSAPGPEEEIFTLIKKHHISGVVLRSDYDNFASSPNTIDATYDLVVALQTAEYESSLEPSLEDQTSPAPKNPAYIPLFIGISQEGDGAPYSQIHSGLSPLPSQMAIGATWDGELAKSVGKELGAELEALGINLLLGPSLDVLEDPRLIGTGDLGVRSFGGDPYWVSLLGKAYIEGIHEGSGGKVGVIAKHFPGIGGGDRPPSEEIATIRKSLSLLQQVDLVPFLSVANSPPGSQPAIADGFLTSNVRYQGFQGNIRATTRPLSLDREAFDQLMSLEGLESWREGGGITMSDALGSRAMRRFIDSLGQPYKGHLIARDAFLAGNDLLYLANIQSTGDPDEGTTILSILAFFAQKYREDSVFAQRVDEAVLKILKCKLRLYDQVFDIRNVIPNPSQLEAIGASNEIAIEVARRAATLISPIASEGEKRVGSPPSSNERIVFFSDSRAFRQCSTCPLEIDPPVRAMQDAVLKLYGPGAANQIREWNVSSYSMADLANYFGISSGQTIQMPITPREEVEEALFDADWLVFTIQRSSDNDYGSIALKYLLDTRPELIMDKQVIVFALNVPYDLDATQISKIDAYYALYSKIPPFIDFAARLLFQEALAEGASPVSIPGIGYDLIQVTGPDPDQMLTLQIEKMNEEAEGQEGGEDIYTVGDSISIETGTIIDTNGHPVPDGTPVEFVLVYQAENIPSLELLTTTKDGKGKVATILDRAGLVTIQADSSAARSSESLQINVISKAGNETEIPAEPTETATPEPEPTNTIQASQIPIEGGSEGGKNDIPQAGQAGLEEFILAFLGVGLIAGIAYSVAVPGNPTSSERIRIALIAAIGALVGYNYIALGLPGSRALIIHLGPVMGMISAVIGGGISIMFFWYLRRRRGN